MTVLNIKANHTQIIALKAFMKAMKIKFELPEEDNSSYNPEFVKKIKQGDKDLKNGKSRTVTLEELDNLWK